MKPVGRDYFDRDCCKPFFFEGNENGILLMHGFTGSVAHMRPLGDALHEKGYTVMGINLPGHAVDEEAMAKSGWQEWLDAARQAAAELQTKCATVTACGLSMGGVLALLLAEEKKADACIPISTPMATQNKLTPLAGLAAPLWPRISRWSEKESRKELNRDYDYGYSGFPTRKAVDLQHLIKMARKNLDAVSCPVLCVQSHADETIWKGSGEAIMNGISSQDHTLVWLQSAPHVSTLSKELPTIIEAIDSFMKRVFP